MLKRQMISYKNQTEKYPATYYKSFLNELKIYRKKYNLSVGISTLEWLLHHSDSGARTDPTHVNF